MYWSLSAGSPHVMEPDCPTGSRVWSDLLLQRSNRFEYLHGRYALIRGTSSRPHPSRFLHLEHTSSGDPSTPRATSIPMILASHEEGLQNESCNRKAGSDAVGSGTAGSNIAHPNATGSSDGTTLAPATPILWESASNPIPTGSSAAEQDYRVGSHLRLLCRQTCCHWQAGCHYPWEASYLRQGQ